MPIPFGMTEWAGGLGDRAVGWINELRHGYSQLEARNSYRKDKLDAAGPQAFARTWRTHPLDIMAEGISDAMLGRDHPAWAQTSDGLKPVLDFAASGLEPSGPATVSGHIPPSKISDIMEQVYGRLTTKAFRAGTTPTVQMGKNTIAVRIADEIDVETAQDYAIKRFLTALEQDVPDEVLAQGSKETAKHLYSQSVREGLLGLRRDPEHLIRQQYDDVLEETLEGGTVDKLGDIADFRLGSKTAVEEAFTPGLQQAKEIAVDVRQQQSENTLSQVFKNIMNPNVRKILTQLDESSAQLARERYGVPTGQPLADWMRKKIYAEKKEAVEIARSGTPGMVVDIGAPAKSQQWAVVRNALMSQKSSDLDARIGVLPEAVREATREYLTRRVRPLDLVRKYKKQGLTQQALFDALQSLTHEVK